MIFKNSYLSPTKKRSGFTLIGFSLRKHRINVSGFTLIRTSLRENLVSAGKGFTLIELLVVMTIMSILFGVGFVAYRDFSRRQTVTSGARKLDGLLRKTQSLAISGEKPSVCAVDEILDGYVFEMDTSTTYVVYVECPPDPSTLIEVESGSLSSGVIVTTGIGEQVYFNALAKGVDFSSGGSSLVYTVSYAQAGVVADQTVTVTKGGQIQ